MPRTKPDASLGKKTSTVTDQSLRQFVGYNLKRAFNALQADLTQTLRPFDLRMITYSALSLVIENPGIRPSQLAQALSIERANLVVIVDELEQRGWLTRTTSQEDRRSFSLHATLPGQLLFEKACHAVQIHDARVLKNVASEDLTALHRALAEIEAIKGGTS